MKTITREHIHFSFDPAFEPAETAGPGETVRFLTKDCYDGQIDRDGKDFAELDMTRNNPVTGPLFVKGAEPGDILKVDILSIVPEDHGVMCVRPGKGIYEVQSSHCRRFEIKDGLIRFDGGRNIPLRMMIGVIGTTPAEPRDTQSPDAQAAMLLSLAGDLRISQVVNPKKGCVMQFPKRYL